MTNSYFKKFSQQGIPFMETCERGDIKSLLGGSYHIQSDFGFINSKKSAGDYAVFRVAEVSGVFFFGGKAVTDTLHVIDSDNMRDALATEVVTFEEYTAKNGNTGIAIRFSE